MEVTKPKRPKTSLLEHLAMQVIKEAGLPTPLREYRLTDTRRWRGDMVWILPDNTKGAKLLLLEVMGGVYTNGGHVRGKGYENDCEKANWAVCNGYAVLRVTHKHLVNGMAVQWVKEALFGIEDQVTQD